MYFVSFRCNSISKNLNWFPFCNGKAMLLQFVISYFSVLSVFFVLSVVKVNSPFSIGTLCGSALKELSLCGAWCLCVFVVRDYFRSSRTSLSVIREVRLFRMTSSVLDLSRRKART